MNWNRVLARACYGAAGVASVIALLANQSSEDFPWTSLSTAITDIMNGLIRFLPVFILYRLGRVFSNRIAMDIGVSVLNGDPLRRPYVFMLRPFFVDQHLARSEPDAWFRGLTLFRVMDPRRGLEDSLERAIRPKADLIKLGSARFDSAGSTLKTNSTGLFGFLKRKQDERFDPDKWHEIAMNLAENAAIIVLVPLIRENSATDWEIEQILSNNWTNKLIFIMPPKGKIRFDDGDLMTMEEAWAESRHYLKSRYKLNLPRYCRTGALLMRKEGSSDYLALTHVSSVPWSRKHSLRQTVLFGRSQLSAWRELSRIWRRYFLTLLLLPTVIFFIIYNATLSFTNKSQLDEFVVLTMAVLSLLVFYRSNLGFTARFSENRKVGEQAYRKIFFSATLLVYLSCSFLLVGPAHYLDRWIMIVSTDQDRFTLFVICSGFTWITTLSLLVYTLLGRGRTSVTVVPHL